MTNQQIIADIAVAIYGEDAVRNMIECGEEIPLHTARGWLARGFRVKEGKKGLETRLWKKKRSSSSVEEKEKTDKDSDEGFYLAKAFLFRRDQIEAISE